MLGHMSLILPYILAVNYHTHTHTRDHVEDMSVGLILYLIEDYIGYTTSTYNEGIDTKYIILITKCIFIKSK